MGDQKLEYRKNRKKGLRGQGDVPEPIFHNKGEKVTRMGWDAEKGKYVEKDVLNDSGSHMVWRNKKPALVNRKESRRRAPNRFDSKKQLVPDRKVESHPAPVKGKPQFSHRSPEVKHPEPLHDPSKSNRQRMLDRKEARDARQEASRQAQVA